MIKNIFKSPVLLARLLSMKKDIYRVVAHLETEAYLSDEPLPRKMWNDVTFVPFKKGERWADKKFGCAVLRFRGTVPAEAKGKQTVALLRIGGEGEIYRDGKPVCIITPVIATVDVGQPLMGKQVVPLFDSPNGGEEVFLEADCGHNGITGNFVTTPKLFRADIAVVDEEKKGYYYDYLSVFLTLATRGENEFLSEEIVKNIKNSLDESYALYRKGDVAEAREKLSELFTEKQENGVEYTAIGQGHLDLAWKWPMREGKRKAVRTFTNVVNFLDKYDFVFGASQAQMFEWAEEAEPLLFEKIKEKVAEGKIELQGGMWVESDCNMPCGESLIRQFLYGKEYFESRFMKDSDVVWLPDAFGFPSTFPQIIKGVGKKYFMTIKLHRNEHNEFPLQSFNWVAPDGSLVIAHIAPEGTYVCSASPISFVKSEKKNLQKDIGRALLIYGAGDGGGGPGEGHLELLKRSGGKYHPKTRVASTEEFFRDLEKTDLPRYENELYLEKHQGTYTSQSKNKYYNRLAERKLHNLEWLEAVTGQKYANRDEIWKKVLLYQFHDILPGSSVERVHRESVEDYVAICKELDEAIENLLKATSKGDKLTVLNPSPFDFSDTVVVGEKLYKADCRPYSSCEPVEIERNPQIKTLPDGLENEIIRVKFDLKSGVIMSVYDKVKDREYALNGVFHQPVIYTDPKGLLYDAWDLSIKYPTLPKIAPTLENIEFSKTVDGACATLAYRGGKSRIEQKIYIKDDKTIYFDTKVDWQESHKMLRAVVTPSLWSKVAEFDVQFGSIERSTKEETSLEKAAYEVCGHYYASVGDDVQGYVSLMNRAKYGYRAKCGELSLNLLRAPTFPDKTCDRGEQSFSYAIAFADSKEEVVKRGYLYNNPPLITACGAEIGSKINEIFGNFQSEVIVETIKKAEHDDGVVIRAYERYGREAEIPLNIPSGYLLYETDMLERNGVAVDRATFAPHQIKTFVLVEKDKCL